MRRIFVLLAWVIDANGTFSVLSGYPKTFDSKNYSGDEHKAYLRAMSDFHETISSMCKSDTRKVQSIVLMDEAGNRVETFTTGSIDEGA